MDSFDATTRLRLHEAELRALGVEQLYLFGSTARDQAGPSSDIDLFFDHRKGAIGLYDLIEIRERAASILGRPADVMTRDSLHPILRARIEATARQVF